MEECNQCKKAEGLYFWYHHCPCESCPLTDVTLCEKCVASKIGNAQVKGAKIGKHRHFVAVCGHVLCDAVKTCETCDKVGQEFYNFYAEALRRIESCKLASAKADYEALEKALTYPGVGEALKDELNQVKRRLNLAEQKKKAEIYTLPEVCPSGFDRPESTEDGLDKRYKYAFGAEDDDEAVEIWSFSSSDNKWKVEKMKDEYDMRFMEAVMNGAIGIQYGEEWITYHTKSEFISQMTKSRKTYNNKSKVVVDSSFDKQADVESPEKAAAPGRKRARFVSPVKKMSHIN